MSSQTAMTFKKRPPRYDGRARQRQAEGDRAIEAQQHGKHKALIAIAQRIARHLAYSNACFAPKIGVRFRNAVTSPQLIAELERRGILKPSRKPGAEDHRLLGGVFPGGKGKAARWRRVGEARIGSRGRPVGIWKMLVRSAGGARAAR